jgi:uncharacterized membrane protein YcaP (DUF421 family)
MKELLGLGIEAKDLGVLQVCIRGIIVFLAVLIMVRVGHKRFMSRMTAFDAVLGFILASALARAINGSAPFLPTLVVGFVLVLFHRLLSALAFYSERIGSLIKGHANVIIEGGKPNEKALRAHKISKNDVLEEARMNGGLMEIEKIQRATLERNGKISIISAEH